MDLSPPANNKVLFDLEVVRARLEIRDFFLNNLFREVYENIAQILSLVRIILAHPDNRIEEASDLVGKSIRDLRDMCKSFYPDDAILKENGFRKGISDIAEIAYPGSNQLSKTIFIGEDVPAALQLFVFNMVLEIFNSIRKNKSELTGISISFTRQSIDIVVSYKGAAISLDKNQQRAEILNGKFQFSEDSDGTSHIKLLCDLNLPYL